MSIEVETPKWTVVADKHAAIAEVPIWSPTLNSLFWIDVFGPALYATEVDSGSTREWELPSVIGSYCLTSDEDSVIVALQSGIFNLKLSNGELTELHAAPYEAKNYRFNDGRCDPAGRFWVGTMMTPESPYPYGTSSFWRLDKDALSRQIDDISVANGIAFSPDGRTIYLADRPNWQILAFDYDVKSGTVQNRRTFIQLKEGEYPDGATVDAEGRYWLCLYRAGRIDCFRPNGELERSVAAPAKHPTMICFGGDDYTTMFVTTASKEMTTQGLVVVEQSAGAVYSAATDISGKPEPVFKIR